jgi:hypothetical protein
MARYYFDWRDNDGLLEDDRGLELPDLEAVKIAASRALFDHARDVFPGTNRHTLAIDVRDEFSRPVLSMILVLEIRLQ